MARIPRDSRAAKIQLERARMLAAHLSSADGLLQKLEMEAGSLHSMRDETRVLIERLEHAALGRIESRVRFKPTPRPEGDPAPEYLLFLDECGNHVSLEPSFPVFCLSGVVIAQVDYETFDVTWKAWKARHLGSPASIVHEPDVRHRAGLFHRQEPLEQSALEEGLDKQLEELDFTCIAAAIDMAALQRNHPTGIVDDYLPTACYLMCMDFVMERFVHFLQHRGQDARGLVLAESRGTLEDAKVHAEFIRLHIEGTQYLSAHAFRHQLRPYIEFLRKLRNSSGLQVADLSARPFAEKVMNRGSSVLRWTVFERKLYDGLKDAPYSYGLKIFPLTELNDPFLESREQAKGDV